MGLMPPELLHVDPYIWPGLTPEDVAEAVGANGR
jgi:hypothetical protein